MNKTAFITDTLSLDLERALKYALMWGVEDVILRGVGEGVVPFVQEKKTKRILEKYEVNIAAVFPPLFMESPLNQVLLFNDEMLLQDISAFCKRMHTSQILVSAFGGDAIWENPMMPDFLRNLGDKLQKVNQKLIFLNETSADLALAQFFQDLNHPHLGTAYYLHDIPFLSIDANYAAIDMVIVEDYQQEHLSFIIQNGFVGTVSISYQSSDKIKSGLTNTVALIKTLRAAVKK